MTRKELTWREREALMRERMRADPTVMEWVKPARAMHRYPEEEPGFFRQAPAPGTLWGLAALGSTFLIPVILNQIQPKPYVPPSPVIGAMRDQLIAQGVCESQANAWGKNEVTPEQIAAMKLECQKERGRNQLIAIGLGALAIIILPQIWKRRERAPEIPLRAKQVGYSRDYPKLSPEIQRLIKSREVQRMWTV